MSGANRMSTWAIPDSPPPMSSVMPKVSRDELSVIRFSLVFVPACAAVPPTGTTVLGLSIL